MKQSERRGRNNKKEREREREKQRKRERGERVSHCYSGNPVSPKSQRPLETGPVSKNASIDYQQKNFPEGSFLNSRRRQLPA
jgi:hypothetical protein